MFRNRKVILPSVAIVFTLIVCSILVNFALANSGTPAGGNNANSIATTALTGYTNIDLAVMASNDAGKKATGEDKYRILQILPESMSSYAQADQAMTAKVTADGYSGTINKEANYKDTSSLWKYVYDGEFFRYAVFNGYKTISANMAEGAVQLTTATVGELNSMNDAAQEILASADFIYIAAFKAGDYGAGGTDLSEDLYSWLDAFATVDRHPVVIDWYALCTDDPGSITGNNDTYRMGTLAYKLMTTQLISRYNNVLITKPDFFADLFNEAKENMEVPPMTSTTKTISDFILTAERGANEGGRNYIGNNRYYKWYTDVHSFEQFTSNDVGTYYDSSYAQIETSTKDTWSDTFDNAKVLIISEDAENSDMFNLFKDMNDSLGGAYNYDKRSGIWQAEAAARNSEFTSKLYANANSSAYIPSGADLFLLDGHGETVLNALSASGTGATFADIDLANSYYRDIQTMTLSGTVTSAVELPDLEILLMVQDANGTYHYVGSSDNMITATVMDVTDYSQEEPVVYSYEYSFEKLNADAGYTYLPILNNATSSIQPGNAGSNGYDFDIVDAEENRKEGYDYDAVNTHTEVIAEELRAISDGSDPLYLSSPADRLGPTQNYYVSLQEDTDVEAYVEYLHDAYQADITTSNATPHAINLSDYDFIFIDKGTYSEEIGDAAYQALCAAAEANIYFIVSSEAGDGIGSGTGEGGSSEKPPIIVNSPSAKALADIINAGVYRDGADNKYRVLEIQPNYPIDTELAASLPSGGQKWEKHSDGSAVTGDYYTIPSDVVEGRAKEELPTEKTEYYDFDLTKAKIAYAIDGVEYSDIELTQVSTEALIGMADNISATYDLVYIGGDYSALDRTVDEIYTSDIFAYIGPDAAQMAKGLPTFIMYYHTGALRELGERGAYKMTRATDGNIYPDRDGSNMLATPYVGTKAYKTTYLVENGNDLTKTKYDELLAYVSAGRPIMISNELTAVYDKMTDTASGTALSETQLLQGYWYNDGSLERGNIYLDPSSRMYDLLEAIKTRATGASGSNVIWGFDASDTQMVENADGDYGDTLYTYNTGANQSMLDADAQGQGWYNDEDTIKNYAVVFSDDTSVELNDLVTGSNQRTRLTILSKPVKYMQGIEATYLRTPNLSFTFTVEGSLANYNYALYVDKDKNTVFDEENDYYMSGVIKSGEEKTVNMTLDPDFFGAASWYLEITNGDDVVVASQTGISKIINLTDGTSQINVLQIQTMSEGQDATSWTATDTLYFDIQSQTAHKILRYNTYANQTQLDTISAQQYKVLGRHENRFGIVEYDMDIHNDDYLSNLADAITDDYDVNLDMVVASEDRAKFTTGDNVSDTYDCLDTWVKEAETLAGGGQVEGHTQAEYKNMVNTALTDYSAKMAAVDAPKAALDAYLQGAIQKLQGTYTGTTDYGNRGEWQKFFGGFQNSIPASELIELFEYMQETGEYYMIFWPMYSTNTDIKFADGQISTTMFGREFVDLYEAYRDAKDAELDARDTYQKYLRRSYGKDFMKKMYSILILGPSDSFGGFKVDMQPKTCEYILDYVGRGGDLFFFHDTMTPFSTAGAVHLTESLMDIVGMNRFHVDFTDEANTYQVTSTGYVTGFTNPTPARLIEGELEEEGYIYTLSPNNGQTASIPDQVVWGTLTEPGYVYVQGPNNGNIASTPAGYYKGTLQEDGWVYATMTYEYAGDLHNWNGVPINGWEYYGDYDYTNESNQTSHGALYRKWATAGTTGYYLYQDAKTYEKLQVVVKDGNYTANWYMDKYLAEAGTEGYIFQEGKDFTQMPVYRNNSTENLYVERSDEKMPAGTKGLIYQEADPGGNPIYGTDSYTDVQYKSTDTDKYYMTPYAFNTSAGEGLINSIHKNINESYSSYNKINQNTGMYVSALSMTSLYYDKNGGGGATHTLPYIYAQSDFQTATSWSAAANMDQSVVSQTVKAKQLNEGLVTLYPFGIGDSLNISGTHQQAYALDLEKENVTVWYTLAGSNNTNDPKKRSSLYAATPYDAMENYFIYTTSYKTGTITYCGAGHCSVTGQTTKNNDERKLFINVIVNSAEAVTPKPSLKVYEPDTDFETELEKDEEVGATTGKTLYKTKVDSKTDTPNFDFKVNIPEDVEVSMINIYYDLDYDEDFLNTRPSYNSGTDHMVKTYTTQDELKDIGKTFQSMVRDANTNNQLQLRDEYFTPYGGNYTYIVLEVYYTGSTKPVYVMIKITVSDPLFELTQADTNISNSVDAIAEEKFVLV